MRKTLKAKARINNQKRIMKMKNIVLILLLVISASPAFSQMPPDSKPDMELTKAEAELRIAAFQSRVNELKEKLAKAEGEKEELQKQLDQAIADLKDCEDALASLLGGSAEDVEAFRQALGVIEGKVREMKRMSNDELADKRSEVEMLDADLNKLRGNKLSLLPEFYNKILTLAKEIDGLYREKKIKSYTVGTWAENRDCLWNIAGKTEIYGDPFQWPKIWQANKGEIRNPDVIFPGQVLTLPAKGPMDAEEKKAARKYYREKRDAMDATTGGEVGSNE